MNAPPPPVFPNDFPKPFEQWEHEGIACAMAAGPYSLNGYAQLPEVLRGKYDDRDCIPVECHWGLTYGPNDAFYVGFDTVHSGDFWPETELGKVLAGDHLAQAVRMAGMLGHSPLPWGVGWSVDRLRHETNRLAEGLRELAAQCA